MKKPRVAARGWTIEKQATNDLDRTYRRSFFEQAALFAPRLACLAPLVMPAFVLALSKFSTGAPIV
ncbi:hypothetical protein D9M70_230710 [compost metagenome]